MNIKKRCKRIWKGYKLYSETAFVARKGFELVGMTAETEMPQAVKSTFIRRGESVMEHQAKTAWLTTAFLANFPDFFGGNDAWSWVTVATTLGHDVGETATGDIPDDGNELHGTKDVLEYKVLKSLAKAYGHDQHCIKKSFKQFQNKKARISKAEYALDKVEAVLTQILSEMNGIKGCIDGKPYTTSLDRKFMEITGTNSSTDCWAAHVKCLLGDFPKKIRKPIFTLMEVAIMDARGKKFTWWDDCVPSKG